MDLMIILIAILTFIIFLTVQFSIFVNVNKKEVSKWLIRAFLIVSLAYMFFGISLRLMGVRFLTLFLAFFLCFLMVYLYVISVFGIMATSIRIRLLSLITSGKKQGVTKSRILKVYNKKVILKKRLERLAASGDLKLKNGEYSLGKRFSYFIVNDWILRTMRKLYW